jgi:hypothetical protein
MAAVIDTTTSPANFVAAGSREVMVEALVAQKAKFSQASAWLGKGHPYSGDVLHALRKTPKIRGLAHYVAESSILHAFDGWNYVSRAADSLIRGDRRTTIHLAYYAELRAGMSLLASHGIGVFNGEHFALATGDAAVRINSRGTHPIVREALREWGTNSTGAKHVLANVVVENRSIEDWLQLLSPIGGGEMIRTEVEKTLTREWLERWSIDLDSDFMKEDADTRNEVSYRPGSIRWPSPPEFEPASDCIEPLLSLWEMMNPSVDGSADLLDKYLLVQAIKKVFEYAPGAPRFSSTRFARFIRPLATEASGPLFEFLSTAGLDGTPLIFKQASKRRRRYGSTIEEQAVPVVCRALLLLRLASAACVGLLKAASVPYEEVEFWWSRIIRELGLADERDGINTLADLWNDVGATVTLVEEWAEAAPNPSQRVALAVLATVPSLSQFQRPGLWLLGSA